MKDFKGSSMIFSLFKIISILVFFYLLLAYFILPFLWKHYEHNPALESFPKFSRTASGIPGDPLNIGLVGSENEIMSAMILASWTPADPITFANAKKIVVSILAHKDYASAPVSNLYLWNRKEDFAFEKEVGGSPKARHHVRFWKSALSDTHGRPFWVGAATYDKTYGLSHRTGQITHHISPDIDSERDALLQSLAQAGQLSEIYQASGIGPTLRGKNGGGDRYYSDGELSVGIISPENKKQTQAPPILQNPFWVQMKNQGWEWIKALLEPLN